MYNPSLVLRVNKFVLPSPFPVLRVLFGSFPVNPADETGYRYPEQQGDKYNCSDHIVFQEFKNGRDTNILKDIDDANDGIWTRLLALSLVTEPLVAGGTIRKDITGLHSVTRTVQILPATSLACVFNVVIAHAGLLPLGFTVGNTFPVPAFTFFYTVRLVGHMVRFRTFS